MPRRPESPGQFDLFDAGAGKPMPPEEEAALPEQPVAEPSTQPTDDDERDATALFYGEDAKLVTPADRTRDRDERRLMIEETLRRFGRPTGAPLLDAAERKRRDDEARRKRRGS